MGFRKAITITLFVFLASLMSHAQSKNSGTDKVNGSIKGKVRVETGNPSGVTVILRKGEQELTQVSTDKNGEFLLARVTPGVYGLTFRKPGLSIGTIEDVEVKAGQKRTLGDRMVLTIDEGSIAFIRGSVFSPEGRSVPNIKVELSKISEDGTVKKIDGRLTNETGSFVFRLAPEVAKYRISVRVDSADPISRDVEVDGAAVYRVALSLPAKP